MSEIQFEQFTSMYELFVYLFVGIVLCFAAFSGFKAGVSK